MEQAKKRSFPGNCVPKQSLGTRKGIRHPVSGILSNRELSSAELH